MTDAPLPAQTPPPQPPEAHRHGGWLVVLGVVGALAVGGIAAAVISRGDEGTATTTVPFLPTVEKNTTINNAPPATTTVEKTVTTPPSTVTVEPQVTIAPQQGATGP